jgi:lysine 2,3-aminomutase
MAILHSIESPTTVSDSSRSRLDSLNDKLAGWAQLEVESNKPPVPAAKLAHARFDEGEFWRDVPAYRDIDAETFLDHKWQARQSVTSPGRLRKAVEGYASAEFLDDVEEGFKRAAMAMRVSPYLLSLVDWANPYNCPIRAQFIPAGKRLLEDHPKQDLDTLHEQADSPTPGLTHRYIDKALFLPINTCPVYCRFCTRSYAVGVDTDLVEKVALRVDHDRWRSAFAYVASRPELEDVVISGGDAYNLRPEQLEAIGINLLSIPHVRRIRIATKGLAIMPQKVLTDHAWLDAVTRVDEFARRQHKDVAIHTHFNHPREITWISRQAMGVLHERGITVRNQAVLQRGVNDDNATMMQLVRRLGYINVHPYYVYVCDMVKGIEDLRTSLATALRIEKHVRGSTAGFNTPTFVCDLPGGGGKRCAHSYEYYNQDTGIAIYTAPSVKKGVFFLYFDPLHSLNDEHRLRWRDECEQQRMVNEALIEARACVDV